MVLSFLPPKDKYNFCYCQEERISLALQRTDVGGAFENGRVFNLA